MKTFFLIALGIIVTATENPVPLKTELDELQEEVQRRAREQELRWKREKEIEAAMGFNPRPRRFLDLDELQNQGNFQHSFYVFVCL